MKVQRRFTRKGKSPYQGIIFEERTSEIRDPDGKVIFHQDGVVVPGAWSQIATDILAQKYFRKTGVPNGSGGTGGENDARQVFHRLAHTWTDWGRRHGYFTAEEDAECFYDEISHMLARQMAAPNSPQWFNTGLFAVYGIKGPAQGHHYVDPKSGELEKASSAYERPQPHACFIISVADDLVGEGGIMELVTSEARLFKYGSGTGTNYSRLRGKGEPLSGGGISSGLLSFLKVGDRSASAIKSGGTTRRAARMVTLDADHPDVEDYVNWKVDEEQKVVSMVVGSRILRRHTRRLEEAVAGYPGNNGSPEARAFDPKENPKLREAIREALGEEIPPTYVYRVLQLLRQGFRELDVQEYTTEWDEAAYATVSGQSSNNSVRLTAEFMQQVLDDGEWTLGGRVDRELKISMKARHLWDRIAYAAWNCADPGVQYHSTINEWHTCPQDGEIRASNPCSEYMFLDDTACNLASLNVMAFYDPDSGRFDVDGFTHAIELWTVVLEISVLMAQFPSEPIARKSFDYRTLGLGYANLGSLLMVMGIPYDSEEGRAIAAALSAILTGQAYATSARMAGELGPFPRFEANREPMLRVIRNHRRAIYASPEEEYEGLSVFPRRFAEERCVAELTAAARAAWDQALELGEKHGYRNAQVTAIAPTGTIGLVMDCDTTGVEPDFALVKFKKLAGGGSFKIINASIPPALKRLGYTRKQVEEITAYCVGRKTLKGAPGVSWEALKGKGFGPEALERVDQALENAFSLHGAFTPSVLGDEFLEKSLGLEAAVCRAPGFRLLTQLGFSAAEVEAAETYACGTMTLEGAPHLKEEHYPVFDTANRCGRLGRRYIPWRAHIEMMAAVQPFISGAISKTVNMPQGASVEEIKGAYFLSWQRMLKAIAVYRDGSKLSQPLSSLNAAEDPLVAQILAIRKEGFRHLARSVASGAEPAALAAGRGADKPGAATHRTARRPLPNRRTGYTQKAKIGQHSIFLRTGEYPDGGLGEIFLDMHREGAAFRSLMNSFAIAVSLGLQYGVPLEEYVDAFVFTRFEPNGIVQGHDNIKITTSVLDFIFRDLALSYLKRGDLVQVKPDDLIATGTNGKREEGQSGGRGVSSADRSGSRSGPGGPRSAGRSGSTGAKAQPSGSAHLPTAGSTTAEPSTLAGEAEEVGILEIARIQGYEGDPCSVCGHLTLVRNGTCLKCLTCGSTTGCS